MDTDKYLWGRRSLANYIVRPIPRIILPDKDSIYEWSMVGGPDLSDWRVVLGWKPQAGFATGFVADLFSEYSWWGVIAAFFYGALPGLVWRRAQTEGGIWFVQLGLVLILAIYVPSQSVSAFLQRFLFMSILTWLAWRMFLGKEWDRWMLRQMDEGGDQRSEDRDQRSEV